MTKGCGECKGKGYTAGDLRINYCKTCCGDGKIHLNEGDWYWDEFLEKYSKYNKGRRV